MTLLYDCLILFYTFFKIGVFGFGGGYAMMSMIMVEGEKMSITADQLADMNALDMVVPGPIAINAATYVGYLHSGFWGSLAATVGVCMPSFIIVAFVLHFINKYRKSSAMKGVLLGVKPAAVGLIAYAALSIGAAVVLKEGVTLSHLLSDPTGSVSFMLLGVFLVTALANIRFKVNPILLTVLAGIFGAIFMH